MKGTVLGSSKGMGSIRKIIWKKMKGYKTVNLECQNKIVQLCFKLKVQY